MSKNYIGYYELENFLKVVEGQKVYGALSAEDRSSNNTLGIVARTHKILLQFIDNDLVYYIRIRTGITQIVHGKPLTKDGIDLNLKHSVKAWELINTYFKTRGISITEANISMPKNIVLIEGGWSRLEFDRDAGYSLGPKNG